MATELRTAQGRVQLALAANSTETSFPVPTGTTTAPSLGLIDLPANESNNSLIILPYGLGTDGQTFDLRVVGWHRLGGLYVPFVIAELNCTLGDGTAEGVAGELVLDTEWFCDTVVVAAGSSVTDIHSPADNTIAWFQCQTKGAALVQIQADLTGASEANAVVGVI